MSFVYALIDPRTEKPFYIGKGTRSDRPERHFDQAASGDTSLKCNVIRKIQKLGLDIRIERTEEISEEDAFEIEMLLISEYGKRCDGTGCLTNLTDGGEGSTGWRHTEESLENLSKAMKGREVTEENKKRLAKELKDNPLIKREGVREKVIGDNHWSAKIEVHPFTGRKLSQETKEKISKTLTGRKGKACSEEQKEKLRQAHLGRKVKDTSKFHWERKRVKCPHCGKEGSVSNMKRWHFDNCKELTCQ